MQPAVKFLLLHGDIPTRSTHPEEQCAGWYEAFLLQGDHLHAHRDGRADELRDIWTGASDELLQVWIAQSPGTRPWGWWAFSAPRWSGPYPARHEALVWSLQTMAEPRQRLGGIGDPAFEHLNVWPDFEAGIPTSWVTPFDVTYYGARFAGRAIDPNDPPRFESQAAYLQRHGLLEAWERRHLPATAFEPETLTPDEDDSEATDAN